MKSLCIFLLLTTCGEATDRVLLWRNPGPIETLDLAAGPGGAKNVPQGPFTFVSEELRGISPKVVVTDATGRKWMVKFGEEVKPDTFGSRIAWAAGYQVRPSYYVSSGKIIGISSVRRVGRFIASDGSFREARFQLFDTASFHAVPGKSLDLSDKRFDTRELNGLKLAALLIGNWDVKRANTAVFEVGGQQYATIADWGASLGDPNAPTPSARKWNCPAFNARTSQLLDGVENGYVQFNYYQYASRHIDVLPANIRIEDLKWFLIRMGKITLEQLRAGLEASGATADEAECFTKAIRKRLEALAAVANGGVSEVRTTTTTIKKTTVTRK